MKQRKKQPALTRQAILNAAGVEFSRHGYAGTGLGAIVGRADLTKGALFHHFADKQALAVAWVGENLAAAIRTGAELICDGRDGRRSRLVLDRMYESATKDGAWVEVEE